MEAPVGTLCACSTSSRSSRAFRPSVPLSRALRVDAEGAAGGCARRGGRRGRRADGGTRSARPSPWLAAPGAGLLFSVNLRPPVETQRLPALTIVLGLAAAGGVREATGLMPEIKLPNDLRQREEARRDPRGGRDDRVVLGMGINVNVPQGPACGSRPRVDLAARGARRAVDRARLLAAILLELERQYDEWVSAGGAAARR